MDGPENEGMDEDTGSGEAAGKGVIQTELAPSLPGAYANHVGLYRTQHEFTLDFFFVEPIGPSEGVGRHVSRIVLPVTLVKGLQEALDEQIERYENDFGFALPNFRHRDEPGGEG